MLASRRRPAYPGTHPLTNLPRGAAVRRNALLFVALCLCSCGKKGPAPTDPPPAEPAKPKYEVVPLLGFWDNGVREHVYTYGDGQPAEYRKNPDFGAERMVGFVSLKQLPGMVQLVRAYCRDRKHYFSLGGPPDGVADVERIEAFVVYVWRTGDEGRLPVHACFQPDHKDPYFDQDLRKVKEYAEVKLKTTGQKQKVVENYFYVYGTRDMAAHPIATPIPTEAVDPGPSPAPQDQPKTQPSVSGSAPFREIESLAVSGDGRRVAGYGSITLGGASVAAAVKVWEPGAGASSARDLRGPLGVTNGRVALSPNGSVVAAYGYRDLVFWNADSGAMLSSAKLPTGAKGGSVADRVAFTADRSAAVVVSDDKIVTVRAADGAVTVVAPADKPGSKAVYVPGLNRVVEARRGKTGATIELASWDPTADRPPTAVVLEGVTDYPSAFDVSADGKVAAVGTGSFGSKGRVTLHDPATGRRTVALPADDNPLFQNYVTLVLSADGKYLAGAGGGDFASKFQTLDLFQTADGRRVHRSTGAPAPPVMRFATVPTFSADGKSLFFVRSRNMVVRVDTATGAEVR